MSTPKNPLALAGSDRAPLPGAKEIGPANPNETVDVTIRLRGQEAHHQSGGIQKASREPQALFAGAVCQGARR
jgi:hypothetical protein